MGGMWAFVGPRAEGVWPRFAPVQRQGYPPPQHAACEVLQQWSPVQSWAAMEEEVGALQRATELRSYRMQGINDVVLPANFGISLSQEPADSPLKAVAATVRPMHPILGYQRK